MSVTIYDSPDDPSPYKDERHWLTIDVTHHWCWFFQHDANEDSASQSTYQSTYVRVAKDELPAIHKAIGLYLGLDR